MVIRGLDAIGRGERDCWLIYWMESKLDTESRRKWIEESKEVSVPTITDFFKFLDSRCEELELAHPKPSSDGKISSPSSNKSHNSTARAFLSIDDCSATHKCIKCGSTNHTIPKCSTFSSMSIQDRRLLVEDKPLCFNCLRAGHTSSTCVSKFRCRRCNRRHHTMLHAESSGPIPEIPLTAPAASPHVSVKPFGSITAGKPWSTAAHVSQPLSSFVTPIDSDALPVSEKYRKALLPTALVSVRTAHGYFIPCRMLIDSASELSYISERCAQKLGIPRSPSRIVVTGIASSKAVVVFPYSSSHVCLKIPSP
ncbi:PREDICTED: uncharacterized protein LOC108373092 [Rhagoletis zephyria]|uniref:uncharacterized protein LOC108373092 n=1 Tax=Rhagoletis zephyria TaxID=28612 RepID=UPI0008115876|nr:PREDICTED: uncharacterized protein LOC108373092 [Rhagoletis zephyria]